MPIRRWSWLLIKHLFEHVSLKRELHIAGMLLRRGIARVSVADALAVARESADDGSW
jgi:hypothetical protein